MSENKIEIKPFSSNIRKQEIHKRKVSSVAKPLIKKEAPEPEEEYDDEEYDDDEEYEDDDEYEENNKSRGYNWSKIGMIVIMVIVILVLIYFVYYYMQKTSNSSESIENNLQEYDQRLSSVENYLAKIYAARQAESSFVEKKPKKKVVRFEPPNIQEIKEDDNTKAKDKDIDELDDKEIEDMIKS